MWSDCRSPGETQSWGSVASLDDPRPPPLPHQLTREGKRWDAPSGGQEDVPTPMCRTVTWRRGTPTAGPGRRSGGIIHGLGGEIRWSFLLSSLHSRVSVCPKEWDRHRRKGPPPKPARPVSKDRVEGVRKPDQQEECRSFHWLLNR